MRVAWLHSRASGFGGAERYVSETAELLAHRGVESTLLYDPNRTADPSAAFRRGFAALYPLADLPAQLRLLSPDLVFAHRIDEESTGRGLLAIDVPVLRFLHDHALFCLREHKITTVGGSPCAATVGPGCYGCLGFLRRGSGPLGIDLLSVRSLLSRQRRARHVAGIVVPSSYLADHAAAHGFDVDRIHVARPFAHDPGAPPAGAARQPAPGAFLFVGALTRGKGVDLLLEAMARTPEPAHLTIVGDGPDREALARRARRADLAGRVVLAGHLEGEALAYQYRRSVALVLPSRAPETFGLVGPEALAHGTPVIASQVGGIGEWLVPEESGLFVPPGDVPALAAALERLIKDEPLRRHLGGRGRALYEERFRPERHAERLLQIFEHALAASDRHLTARRSGRDVLHRGECA